VAAPLRDDRIRGFFIRAWPVAGPDPDPNAVRLDLPDFVDWRIWRIVDSGIATLTEVEGWRLHQLYEAHCVLDAKAAADAIARERAEREARKPRN